MRGALVTRLDGTPRSRLTSEAPRTTQVTLATFPSSPQDGRPDDSAREALPPSGSARAPRPRRRGAGGMQPDQGTGTGLGTGHGPIEPHIRADCGVLLGKPAPRFPVRDGLDRGAVRRLR